MAEALESRLRNLDSLSDVELLRNDVRKNRSHLAPYDIDKLEAGLEAAASRLRAKPRRFKFTRATPSHDQSPAKEGNEAVFSNAEVSIASSKALLYSESMPSLTIANLNNSIIVATDVRGPVYVTNISSCMLILNCRQCRIHDSHKSIIAPGCAEPVIENSDGLEFVDSSIGSHFDTVRDFSWPRRDVPSHNWRKCEPLTIHGSPDTLISEAEHALNQGENILKLRNRLV